MPANELDIWLVPSGRTRAQQIDIYRKDATSIYGDAPDDHHLQLEIFNSEFGQYSFNWQFGLARNVHMRRAQYFHRIKSYEAAVHYWLAVCIYDANGAENHGVVDDNCVLVARVSEDIPLFRIDRRGYHGVLPGITHRLGITCRKAKYDLAAVHEIYLRRAVDELDPNMPLRADAVWELISQSLEI